MKIEKLLEVYVEVEAACRSLGIEVALIGGMAQNIHFLAVKMTPPRLTMDVDLALRTSFESKFHQLKEHLLSTGFRALWPLGMEHIASGIKVDMMPFSNAADGAINLGNRANGPVSVVALESVALHAETLDFSGRKIRLVTQAGIVILKLISHSERPEVRKKDLHDLKFIIKKYFDNHDMRAYQSEICQAYYDRFDQSCLLQEWGACLLGEDMGRILANDPVSIAKVEAILRAECGDKPGPITRYWAANVEEPLETTGRVAMDEEAFADEVNIKRLFGIILHAFLRSLEAPAHS